MKTATREAGVMTIDISGITSDQGLAVQRYGQGCPLIQFLALTSNRDDTETGIETETEIVKVTDDEIAR